ncbi:ankyrin repeat domain-containing protein [Qipengyuania sphaerica]|uniref:ankyrin repeat domain-containing protein n=1 Tax=Qipengyuania sphaerica TaxID=2867243 RepID=UPI001C889217|nr:ankyrin repeat domain-containing protein [Qipengyuania sphaerica]MBX7541265.1 ankyrin repeat domain-containing protein [Qipengyuania sphaerica]
MEVRRIGAKRAVVIGLGALAMLASPLAAQRTTDGYKFIKAVRDRDGTTATQMLDEPGNTFINAREIATGETALHAVVQRRDLSWVRFLLQRGANPNIADKNGVYPIQLAAQLGFIEGVERLIKGGADVDVSTVTGETPLISAVHRRDLKMIELLVEKGGNPDRADNSGRTARDYAMLMGARSGVLEAIEKGESEEDEEQETYGPS